MRVTLATAHGNWQRGPWSFPGGQACCTLYKTHVKVCSDNVWMQLMMRLHQICGTRDLDTWGRKGWIFSHRSPLFPLPKVLLWTFVNIAYSASNTEFPFIPLPKEDQSCWVWTAPPENKGPGVPAFSEVPCLGGKTGKPLKCLCTNNGGEYTSNEFVAYCDSRGRHEKIVPGTPQHNGVAERMNRTIMERVRCMLRMAKLPKPFWSEVVRTACYLYSTDLHQLH